MTYVLARAGTSPLDLLRFAAYAGLSLVLPGTLVYRALMARSRWDQPGPGRAARPRSLPGDLAMGTAVGLVLELCAWAVFSWLDLRSLVVAWPVPVVVAFAAVPRLRRHWRAPAGSVRAPLGWSWAVAGVVCLFTAYLAAVFIDRNPILPTSEHTRQYLDLAYQLSLAGEAKHSIPLNLPQVAGEPLYYHWFGYVHMAMMSMVGGIDLPVVALRFAVPGLCALAAVLTAVAGWRISRRPYVGALAATLFFVIAEFNFVHPVTFPFGTQATFVVWHGMSMTYSWVLLIAAIIVLAEVVSHSPSGEVGGQPVPRGVWVLATALLLASSGAKASSLPVIGIGLALTAVALLVPPGRAGGWAGIRAALPGPVIWAGVATVAAQLFALAVLYRFNSYGTSPALMRGLGNYWNRGPERPGVGVLVMVGVFLAFVLSLLLRTAGIVPLLWLRRGRLSPEQWLLVGGGIAGPLLYLVLHQPSGGEEYFTRAGFAFGVLASAWGYALVWDRARLGTRSKWALGVGTLIYAGALVLIQLRYARPAPADDVYSPVLPILGWAGVLLATGAVVALWWRLVSRSWAPLRGRGALVALTAVLAAGAPGLVMDSYKSLQAPNGGAYAPILLPASRVEAARWVRDHSDPDDIIATNVHCLTYRGQVCDARSFWLSAYAERSVLVEGWGFAPRLSGTGLGPFWDPELLALNDAAIYETTEGNLAGLRDRGVRWIVVDREVSQESPALAELARLRFDNGRLAVYQLP